MYTDAHCHLDFETYDNLDELLADCRSAGVDRIICAGFDLESSRTAMYIAERYDGVYFTAGLHPTELSHCDISDLEGVRELCRHPKCVAVGEIGLDYHYPDTNKPLQFRFFEAQLELAHREGLPVQIHSRDSADDTLQFLKERESLLTEGFLMHCYSYSPEMCQSFLKLGAYFSFGGTSTYKKSKKPRRAIEAVPAGRLLTETDSPYLSPSSKHGVFPNTPLSIPEITLNMAELKGLECDEMSRQIRSNAERLFFKMRQ